MIVQEENQTHFKTILCVYTLEILDQSQVCLANTQVLQITQSS